MQIEMIPISKLTLLENNPRSISKEQMQKLCTSIKDDPEFLMARPVLVNKTCKWDELTHSGQDKVKRHDTYTVYAGNQRVRAAKKLKMKEIPCIVECDIPELTLKKRIILDNKTFGQFDFDILLNEWNEDLLEECGFSLDELSGFSGTTEDLLGNDDEAEEKHVCDKCGKKMKKGKN
jgi:ParB-like chromosome segregation protein Spo0J